MRFGAVASPAYLTRHSPPRAPHDLEQHRSIRPAMFCVLHLRRYSGIQNISRLAV
jgi:hypothetical protein